jgi:hypothetical protein
MGNLSSQYISQSFQSLLHLGSDNTASVTLAEIQDALGNGVGVFVSTAGNLKVNNSISASAISASTIFGFGNTVNYSQSVSDQLTALENITSSLISVTGSYATTGSNNFVGNQNVTGDITLTGTLSAYAVKTIFETSSVIYSSGSNQFGDASNDTQTLIGRTNISGSLSVTGSSIAFRGEVSASYISTSVLQGLGIVSDFSSSVASQFFTSTNYDALNDIKWNDLQPVTASQAISIDNLQIFTSSQQTYNTNNNTKWTTIGNLTGSYATTGSNTFNGNNTFVGTQRITGSLTITGSAYGNVSTLTIASNTASVDLSRGNFFTLTLASSTTTRLVATNIRPGETVSLLITQPSPSGSLTLGSMFKTAANYPYQVTTSGSAVDLVSLVSFDGTNVYLIGANKLQ